MLISAIILILSAPLGSGVGTSVGPAGFDVVVEDGGAGAAFAICDALATACAGTAAAVVHQEATATSTFPILGPGSVRVEADFGVAAVASGVRIVATAETTGTVSVTQVEEEEKVIKGDDECQWYNLADWAGHCDEDETIQYHVRKENAVACPAFYAVATDPTLAGDFATSACSRSAGEDVVCMQAEADASATSNVGNAKPTTATASNCDEKEASNVLASRARLSWAQVRSLQELSEEHTPHRISFRDLPPEIQEDLIVQAQAHVEAIIRTALESNYEGPEEERATMEDLLIESATSLISTHQGMAITTFNPSG